ncbi:type VI secretion system tip protein VgrG [Rugamonas sp. CCM 8940]|uniref:type VI secretion system Vgr family protein n=2 Tax=Rugamonas sp. CCM 8940 TaxID=2765359 RepID=UPI0018F6E55F|nr:type VI secretion system tip protein TssI/VgrG [Rugamonas sp. CCM 8940]MBJ7310783.1 type VI secretion system tip protein VgrG [Rugamonas sp. CCM 8940]
MNLLPGVTALLSAFDNDPQGTRLLRLDYPRGDGPASLMLVNTLRADEAVSRDFHYDVEILSDDALIPLKAVMGKMVTISLVRDDGSLRHFNGYVFAFRFVKTDGGFAFYQMTLKPWLAFLRLRHDNRCFHSLTLTELCEKIFFNYLQRDHAYRFVDAVPMVTLANQYDESDHNHLHRRLEAAGMHYWYEHRADGHTLCLGDNSTLARPIDGGGDMRYQGAAGAREEDGISQWSPARRLAPGKITLGSHNFKNATVRRSERPSLNRQGAVPRHDVYLFTGAYGFRNADGEALAIRRMEEIDAGGQDFSVSGNHRAAEPRRTFRMSEHFSGGRKADAYGPPGEDKAEREYLILSVCHHASNNYQNGRGAQSHYSNQFTCLRKSIRWRPPLGFHSRDTRIYGVQTATVVGPEGQEIHTDQYGRVRIQWHWDREGKFDAHSSPYVRVMTASAGARFGQISVPRVGQEVVVQFLDGNPDRPLIIGSVYNAVNMPPWELPANQTQSGILTRSSRGGDARHANALRFEDRKGQEEVWLHAEKDQRIEVEHDESHSVGNDRRKQVGRDETVDVGHDRTETVGNDEKVTVHGGRTVRVDHDERIDIGDNRMKNVGHNEIVKIGGSRIETVMLAAVQNVLVDKATNVGGACEISVGMAMTVLVGLSKTIKVCVNFLIDVGEKISILAGEEFRVKVGSASLSMKSNGEVHISGTKVTIDSSGPVQINGKNVDLN